MNEQEEKIGKTERSTLRWDHELFKRVETHAKKNRRSLNAEIVFRLEQSVEGKEDFIEAKESEQEVMLLEWFRRLSEEQRDAFGTFISGSNHE